MQTQQTLISQHSINDELNFLDKDICDIMEKDKEAAGMNKLDTFKELILSLHSQITNLTEEVKFLREDSIKKSDIISKLIDKSRNKEKDNEIKENIEKDIRVDKKQIELSMNTTLGKWKGKITTLNSDST